MTASPVYPNNNSAGRNVTYTFNNITGDGVRIIGTPGGTAHFTSIGAIGIILRRQHELSEECKASQLPIINRKIIHKFL